MDRRARRGRGAWLPVHGPGCADPDDGLSYWLEFGIEGGGAVRPRTAAPPPRSASDNSGTARGGVAGRFIDLSAPRERQHRNPSGYGDDTDQVGRVGASATSSRSVRRASTSDRASDLRRRLGPPAVVLTARGQSRRAVPLHVTPTGRYRGRPAGTARGDDARARRDGVRARCGRTHDRPIRRAHRRRRADRPHAGRSVRLDGTGTWTPVRSRAGVALSVEAQSRSIAAAVPGRDGAVALSQELPGRRIAVCPLDRRLSERASSCSSRRECRASTRARAAGRRGDAARGLWSESGSAVALFRFAADGSIVAADVIAAPTQEMDAASSTVRFRAPDEVLVARGRPRAADRTIRGGGS